MQFHPSCLFVSAVAATAMLAAHSPAQTLVSSVTGPAASAQFGKACIRIADQNADGFEDLLVGAPGYNGGRGAIYCVSGQYLANGSGVMPLWSVAPSVNAGDQFGYALADLGDVTGDGVPDFLVGQPGYDHILAHESGAVRLVDGSTHLVLSMIHEAMPGVAFGSSMAVCGDINLDGRNEVAVGGPGPSPFFTQVVVLWGYQLQFSQQNNGAVMLVAPGIQGTGYAFGASLASGFDLDGDGHQEIAVGIPGWDGPGATDGGSVRVLEPNISYDINGNLVWVMTGMGTYVSTIPNERMGQALDAAHDYDGDGVVDIVAGAPNSPNAGTVNQLGRVVVLSGAKLAAQTPPYEIYTFTTPPAFGVLASNFHFGAGVCASDDLNGDGIGEILVGAPDYDSNQFTGVGRGFVAIYSGATGVQLAKINGAQQERLGDSLAGALQDLDGDGFKEFVAAGSLSDTGATDSGIVKCYRLFPLTPATYCTAKVNSLGCTPAIGFSGSPSESSLAPFAITASNILSQRSGLLFYSHAPLAVPFQGGTKCVADPVMRTPVQNSGGSTTVADCTGTYSLDFNARIQSAVDPTLTAGAEVFAQYWSRDPLSPSTTNLSDALRFVINP